MKENDGDDDHRAGAEVRPRGVHAERAFETFTRRLGSWWPLETHALHPGEVREVVWEEREGGEVYGSRPPATVALGHRACLVSADRPHDRLAGRPDGRGDDGGRGALHARGRRDARRLEHRGWERLGAMGAEARESYGSENGWEMVVGRYAAALGLDADVEWLGGRAVADQRSQELGEAARSEDRLRRRLLQLGHGPPAQPEHELAVELTQERRGCGSNAGVRTRWYCSRWPSHFPPMNGMMWSRVHTSGPSSKSVSPASSSSSRRSASSAVSPGSIPPPGVAHTLRVGNSKRTSRILSPGSRMTARAAGRIRSSLTELVSRRARAAP